MSTANWLEAQRICDLPTVDEAIRNLLEDQTGDNATGVVVAVLEAVAKANAASPEAMALGQIGALLVPSSTPEDTAKLAAAFARSHKTTGQIIHDTAIGEQAPTATHGPLHLTNSKTADIATRGYNIVGYVLRSADESQVCISAESAVRWLSQANYSRLMHEQNDLLFSTPTAADYEEVLAENRRLVRELDVLLNGEKGAAKQAKLSDIVSQVKRERTIIATPEVRRYIETGAAIERACGELPDGFELHLELERGAASLTLYDEEGNGSGFESDTFGDQINAAIARATGSDE